MEEAVLWSEEKGEELVHLVGQEEMHKVHDQNMEEFWNTMKGPNLCVMDSKGEG